MNEAEIIAQNQVKSAVNKDLVTIKSLWENQDCVITFFRGFGCSLCRLFAKQLSEIKPYLDEHNVRLIGIGVEEIGVEEFLEGNFFSGDLFIDVKRNCYKDLNYKRYCFLCLIPALFTKTSRAAFSAASEANLSYDLEGDYYQVGGTLVVKKGGEQVLLSHKQKSLADNVDIKKILNCLNISKKGTTSFFNN